MWEKMEENSIECVTMPSPERSYEAEVKYPQNHHIQPSKSRRKVATPLISSANSVVELLECPVCANSMYPPIHQVTSFSPNRCIWVDGVFMVLFLTRTIM